MRLEEYIVKRKTEDGIDEYDFEKRMQNTHICVNYIFEYFNNYLETRPADEKTALHEQKIDKYRKLIKDYNPEIRDWLISLYASYGKYMHKQLMNLITDDFFLLYDSDAEFRSISYDIYAIAKKRFKFLEGQSEMLFRFVKDAHRVRSLFNPYDKDLFISENVNEWITETYKKYGVNIYNYCQEWIFYYLERPEIWPKGHKKRSEYYYERQNEYKKLNLNDWVYWDYDYRQKSNLFGLDLLYRKMPKKNFTRGKKQEFEAVLMYCWLHRVTKDAEYWEEYSSNVLQKSSIADYFTAVRKY